jgi:hypothetical protein
MRTAGLCSLTIAVGLVVAAGATPHEEMKTTQFPASGTRSLDSTCAVPTASTITRFSPAGLAGDADHPTTRIPNGAHQDADERTRHEALPNASGCADSVDSRFDDHPRITPC